MRPPQLPLETPKQQRDQFAGARGIHRQQIQPALLNTKRTASGADISSPLSELSDQETPKSFVEDTGPRHTRNTRSQRNKKRRTTLFDSASDDEYIDDAHMDDALTSTASKKRSRKSDNSPTNGCKPLLAAYSDSEDESPKKEEPKPKNARGTKRLVRKKPQGTRVPKTLADAGPADKMMWEWKNQGRTWEEIKEEWKKITGTTPGNSTLSVRYIKLNENFVRHGAATDRQLFKFKHEAEEELMSQLWTKVAEKMLAYSPQSEHNPKDLEKRFRMLIRSGLDPVKLAAMEAEEDTADSAVDDEHDFPVLKSESTDVYENADQTSYYQENHQNGDHSSVTNHEMAAVDGHASAGEYESTMMDLLSASVDDFGPDSMFTADLHGTATQHTQDSIEAAQPTSHQQEVGYDQNSLFLPVEASAEDENAHEDRMSTPANRSSMLVSYSSDDDE